ncbi:MAG: DPP IV N-terminal domain-containing protein [Bacteroidota bacterium]|nr:DPP IV N-terminal domain-containing protein [Bacteroidota bacterium]
MKISQKLLLIAISLVMAFPGIAQEKRLSVEDYYNFDLYPKRISNIQWKGETSDYTFLHKNALKQSGISSNDTIVLLKLDELNSVLHQSNIDSIKRFPSVSWKNSNTIEFRHTQKILSVNLSNKTLKVVNSYNKQGENFEFHKDGLVAYTIGQNICFSNNGEEKQITNDTEEGIINGTSVSRSEFGITKGLFWSPKAKQLAFYRKDESKVTQYPLVDVTTRIAELKNTRYPMAGMTSEQITVGVYNIENGTTIFLKTGEPVEQYLTNITWDPEGNYIYISVLNREQNHLKLNKYDAATGDFIATLLEEKNDRYVEPEHKLFFLNNHNDQFVWYSERDGFQHLYLYNTKGELISQLTKGEWVVTDIVGQDPKGKKIIFAATKESPLNNDIYVVNIRNSKIQKVSKNNGTHHAILSSDAKYIIDSYSSVDMAREYSITSLKGKKLKTLFQDENPMQEYLTGEMEINTLKASDSTDLYYRLIKPTDFDPNKKYPAIIYVYGGPHAQLITNSYLGGAGIFLNHLAEQGYVVFTLDNRGSANRGFEFESAIHRNCGTIEVSDQMEGVKFLKSLNYVDASRIGVDGWSYGGFMTISMKLKHPGVFKAACAGGPVIDWKYYEVMYGERYMDTPQENPEGYKNASLLNYVKDLEGRLLIIHGTNDPTVVWQNSQAFVQKCVEEGKLLDYFIYPGHGHNVRGKQRIHLLKKIEQFFEDNLK